MKMRLILFALCLIASAFLCLPPHRAAAQEALGASRACSGCRLGEVNGCPACMEENKLHICENNFPDGNFRFYLQDIMGSKSISPAILKMTTNMDCDGRDIKSMKGIEFFAELKALYCNGNALTSLNVGKNPGLLSLGCARNQLSTLDVSGNPALELLNCYSNRLGSLDVSGNPALKYLNCYSNQLSSLAVGENPALEVLNCYSNQLTELDVSGASALKSIDCINNRLVSLHVSGCAALAALYCSSNQLTSLDVSSCAALWHLRCYSNRLESLDVSASPELISLNCSDNQLSSLIVRGASALTTLNCSGNRLSSLDVSANLALQELTCFSNRLTALNLSKNPALEILYCNSNRLEKLDLSGNKKLSKVSLTDQQMSCRAPVPGELNLTVILEKRYLSRVVSVGSLSSEAAALVGYDPATGLVKLGTTGFYYIFDTGNEIAGQMRVNAAVEPIDVLLPSEKDLKTASGISDASAIVFMEVMKAAAVTEAETKQLEELLAESPDFRIISAYDITVYAVKYDAQGNETGREAVNPLKSAVTMSFKSPQAEKMMYRLVLAQTDSDGKTEMTLLDTTENKDGTVSVKTKTLSRFYLTEAKDNRFPPGDINGDWKVNIFDVIRLLKKVTGEDVETVAATDVNGDGEVNIFDVIRLLKFVTGEKVEVK